MAGDTSTHGPTLLVTTGADHSAAKALEKASVKQSHHSRSETDVIEFADRGHTLTIDHGWADVADAVLDWLERVGV